MFYPYAEISAAQAHESDNLRQAMLSFSLFLSSFSGVQRILGYVRPWRIVAVHPPKRGKRRSIWRSLWNGTASAQRCDVFGLQMLLRRMQSLKWDTANDCKRFKKKKEYMLFYISATRCRRLTTHLLLRLLKCWQNIVWWFSNERRFKYFTVFKIII